MLLNEHPHWQIPFHGMQANPISHESRKRMGTKALILNASKYNYMLGLVSASNQRDYSFDAKTRTAAFVENGTTSTI
jgi:hypothetical protein